MQDFAGGAASLFTAQSRLEAESPRRRSDTFDEPILRLLLNGVPDKAIAARLQVSERTIQRHVRILLAKVGARNRMQLGQILACRSNPHPHPQPHPQRLTEFDAQILKMLLQGQAESAIAETLSVSRRTVQRSVKGMMSRAGAANRVQLGWHAQRSGWI